MGVLNEGVIYWRAVRDRKIFTFDLTVEKFLSMSNSLQANTLGESMRVLEYYKKNNSVDVFVWMNQEYLFDLCDIEEVYGQYVRAVVYSNSGRQLLHLKEDGKLFWLDWDLKHVHNWDIPGLQNLVQAEICTEASFPSNS